MSKLHQGMHEETHHSIIPRFYFAHDHSHLDEVATALVQDEIGAFPYNGPYAFLGRHGSEVAAQKIYQAKDRPPEKKLVTVARPVDWHERIEFNKTAFSQDEITQVMSGVHALGMILPLRSEFATTTPTELMMWTNYQPLSDLYDIYRRKSGGMLLATSVNKSGQPTNIAGHEVYRNFRNDGLSFIVQDVVNQIEKRRMQSTTVLNMTRGRVPIVHRLGNVSQDEVQDALVRAGLPPAVVSPHLVTVSSPVVYEPVSYYR